jgi:hypothetical protein
MEVVNKGLLRMNRLVQKTSYSYQLSQSTQVTTVSDFNQQSAA